MIEVNAQARGKVVALGFHQNFFTHEETGIERLPVQAGKPRLIQNPSHEKRVGANHSLLELRADRAKDGAGHVLTHTHIGHCHRT